MSEPSAFPWPDRPTAAAELDSDLARFNAVIPQLDARMSAEVTRLEAVVQELLSIGKADLEDHPFRLARDYAALKRAEVAGRASVGIRAYVWHRSIGSLDTLCAQLTSWVMSSIVRIAWLEVRLYVRAWWRLFRWSRIRAEHGPLRVTPFQLNRARRELKRRAGAQLTRQAAAAAALARTLLTVVILFAAISAGIGKLAALLSRQLVVGWLVGPITAAIVVLVFARPLARRVFRTPMTRTSHSLLLNWLGLLAFEADSEVRLYIEKGIWVGARSLRPSKRRRHVPLQQDVTPDQIS
jgi:hypothetical protein